MIKETNGRSRRIHSTTQTRPESEEPMDFLYEKRIQKQTARGRKRKLIFTLTAILLLYIIYQTAIYLLPANITDNPYDYDPITLEPKKPKSLLKKITNAVFRREPSLKGQRNDRVNILLLGMGGAGHDGPYLTDTIIITSIRPSTGDVAMISIPRDLAVEIPGYGLQKINHANAYGESNKPGHGAELAVDVVENTFDIKIPYYALIDFKAFEEIVDVVGGIKVDIERSFVDNKYPAPNKEYQTLTFHKGIETMDGKRALKYARSRHGNNGEGSDFARAKRQQKVLLALKEKLLSFKTLANPIRVNNIIKSLGSHIKTNMSFSDVIFFIKMVKGMDKLNIITAVIDAGENGYLRNGYTKDGAYILRPKTGNFKEINKMIKNVFELTPENKDTTPIQDMPQFTQANIEIQNGTWNAGLAARIRKKLKKEGLNVTLIGNTNKRPAAISGVYDISNKQAHNALSAIQTLLRMPIKQQVPVGETAASTTDILIILGNDFVE